VITREKQGASMRNTIITILAALVLSGCAPIWVRTSVLFQGAGYTVELPQGWMATRNPKSLVVTHDGPELQSVYVHVVDLSELEKKRDKDKPAGKLLTKGMLPQEAAETILDGMQSNKRLSRFTVIENKPAKVGGKDGFRLDYTYKDDKLRNRCIFYGMLHEDKFYRISYCATVRYYFDKDLEEFENIAASFKVD
jgi:hypothetical protein